MSDTKKIKYVDKDDMHLVVGLGNPVLIRQGEIKEFPTEMADSFLRDTKTVISGFKDKEKKIPILKVIPKWVEVSKTKAPEEKKTKKEAKK